MGFGFPAAIGAAMGLKSSNVWQLSATAFPNDDG